MYRLGKLVIGPHHVGRNITQFCCIKNLLTGIVNQLQEPSLYSRKVFVHSMSYKNIKALKTMDLQSISSTITRNSNNMSTSINEEFRNLDYKQFVESKSAPHTVVIDVREKKELDETGEIPGAHHIPLGDIESALKAPKDKFEEKYNFEKPSTEDSVIFSCRSGKRSLVALEIALANGFENAKHYKGGWLDWEKHCPSRTQPATAL